MKYYLIAGEASGDMHAANLMKELKRSDPSADFRFWGGDLMEKEGGTLVKHYRDLAFMGFTEVVMNLRTILRNIEFCKSDLLNHKPDALILIDYPGFNLRIAEFAKQHGIKVFYYISPQIWAWKQSRVHKIKRIVDKMYVILPFEKEFYKKFDYEVEFVGHPLLDEIEKIKAQSKTLADFTRDNKLNDKPIVALLPGSRRQEISVMLPLMLSVVEAFPGFQFVIAAAPSVPGKFLSDVIGNKNVSVVSGQTYSLLTHATAALVTSGTATLETALFGVPEVVCYKGGWISYSIARLLIKVDYISLVNLIMNREVVKELIQNELNSSSLKDELNSILMDQQKINAMKADYIVLKEMLGGSGASVKTAAHIFREIGM
ncbi:MAG: lipid-A-disaccharide synthase [Bacteroidota bacterium]